MARLKRKSVVLEQSRRRLAGIRQISPAPALAEGLSIEGFEAEIDGFIADQNAYNGDIAALDERNTLLDDRERRLSDLNLRILAAIKAQYGPDSIELELAGGVRRSERKRPERTTKVPATS